MKNIKKIVALNLAIAVAFSAAACGTEEKKPSAPKKVEESVDRLQADWTKNAIIYEVNVRQYTEEGTFKAFEEHLERLKDMGINTLWFMPIYSISQVNKKGTLGSYYSIQDYKTVNSEFGTNEEFKALIDKAHSMGFHVILDWVANHTGFDHVWINEHPEYYLQDENGEIMSPVGTDWIDVAQLNYQNKDMRAAMIETMAYWIKDMEVDGFRCDYAQGVSSDFWEEARYELNKIKPIYMLAEDGTNTESLLKSAFDSDYNFPLYDGIKMAMTVKNSADKLDTLINPDIPAGSYKMNFLDNHDKNTYDGTLEERFGSDKLGALWSLVFTAEGIPLVYSGNEEDTDIQLEFFEKDNIDFGDYKWEPLLKKLCEIKTTNEALFNGNFGEKMDILEEDNKSVIAYTRGDITYVTNMSSAEQSVKYKDKIKKGEILLHGKGKEMQNDEGKDVDKSSLEKLSGWEYYIIRSK